MEELLQAFSEEVCNTTISYSYYHTRYIASLYFIIQNLDDVCLGHLFTYRDFQG